LKCVVAYRLLFAEYGNMHRLGLNSLGLLGLVCASAWAQVSVTTPDSQPPVNAVAMRQRVDEILARLERRGDGLKDIQCRLRFEENDGINLVKRTKEGRIVFQMSEPNPQFLIHFEKTDTDGVLGKQEWYLFDGHWLFQGLERIKQVTKQEFAKPGEKIDLFDLERTPFPLPFGQKKDTILRNFDVSLVEPVSADPPNTDHLLCIPKPNSRMDRKYDRLEFFVLRDLHLPTRIVVTKNDGLEVDTAEFPDLSTKSINAGVSRKDLDAPAIWKKENYKEVVETLIGD